MADRKMAAGGGDEAAKIKDEKRKLKEEQKNQKKKQAQQKKEAKKKAKEIAAREAELTEDEDGTGQVVLTTLIIVLVWVGIICALIKLDVGGFGSGVIAPIIKNVPVINKILPDEATGNIDPEADVDVAGYSSLKEMREALREERSLEVAALDSIIASETSTIAQKNTAINNKQLISDTTEKEVLMELAIINLGYTDAFVHHTSSGVEVLVVADILSEKEVIEIMNLTYSSFTTDTVVVTYKKVTDFN